MKVYKNGELVGETDGVDKISAMRWIRDNERNTHMGEWFKRDYGFQYTTSIGVYYRFEWVRK